MTSDRIKEELSWLRIVFPLFVAIDAGLVAYIAQPAPVSRTIWMLAMLALSVGIGGALAVIVTVYRLLHALEAPRHDVP